MPPQLLPSNMFRGAALGFGDKDMEHADESDDEPCPHCKKTYIREKALKKHVADKHRDSGGDAKCRKFSQSLCIFRFQMHDWLHARADARAPKSGAIRLSRGSICDACRILDPSALATSKAATSRRCTRWTRRRRS